MAVQSDTSSISYTGNNSTVTSYAVPFVFLENGHLQAIAKVTATGVETAVTLTNHAGAGDPNGGTVRTAVAVPATSTLTIFRTVPATQTTSYQEGGDFPAASHERALDKLTFIAQQNSRQNDRAIRVTEADGARNDLLAKPNSMVGLDVNKQPKAMTLSEVKSYLALSGVTLDVQAGMKTFADSGERALAVPEFTGQLGTERSTGNVYISTGTAAGDWAELIEGTASTTSVGGADELLVRQGGESKRASAAELLQTAPLTATGTLTPRPLSERFSEKVSVKDFGAVGDGVTDDTVAIQAALDGTVAARVYFPAGTYLVSDTLKIPSYRYVYGDGPAVSTIRMAASVGRNTSLVQTGTKDQKREHIVIEGLTLDANSSRWTVTGGTIEVVGGTSLNTNGIALCISYSEFVVVKNVSCLNGYKHCMDVQAPIYARGDGTSISSQPSRYVWVEDCYFTGGGDDNFTSHHSSDIWITRCLSVYPSGVRTPNNSNCFEIDDGTRNVSMTDCVAVGGICGLQIKGHNYSAAPYNVTVDGLRCFNNRLGVEVRHTGYYKSIADEDGLTETLDEEGNAIVFTGASPTARNLTLSNIEIVAPRAVTFGGTTRDALHALRVRSYENVTISNIKISDGSLDLGGDYEATTGLTGIDQAPIRIYGGASNVICSNISIYGFSTSASGLRITDSFNDYFLLNGFVCVNGPQNPIRCSASSSTYRGYITNFLIQGNQPSETAVVITAPEVEVGHGIINGYLRSVRGGTKPPAFERGAASSGNDPINPQAAATYTWQEGDQNLGIGEGLKLSWRAKLVDDAQSFELGYVAFKKTESTDTNRISDFVIGTSANGGTTAPTDRLVVEAGGDVRAATNNSASLGTSAVRWSSVFAAASGFNNNNGVLWRASSGSPEGNVTAPVGSIYSRTNGGAGTSFYVKESGSGNTGWAAK